MITAKQARQITDAKNSTVQQTNNVPLLYTLFDMIGVSCRTGRNSVSYETTQILSKKDKEDLVTLGFDVTINGNIISIHW